MSVAWATPRRSSAEAIERRLPLTLVLAKSMSVWWQALVSCSFELVATLIATRTLLWAGAVFPFVFSGLSFVFLESVGSHGKQ